jgi:hypothetical protein
MAKLTARQTNRLTAYENVETELQLDPSVYDEDDALQEITTTLSDHLTSLKPLRKNGIRPRKGGPAEDKKDAKQHLADVGAEIAGDLYAFGTKTKNRTLQAEADHNSSDLFDLRGTRLVDTAEHLFDLATNLAPAMGKQAISEARRTELRDAITGFTGLKNAPRQQTIAGQAVSLGVGQQFAALAELVQDRLERALRKYKRSHPDFYNRVMAARKVIDLPGSNPGPGEEKPQA